MKKIAVSTLALAAALLAAPIAHADTTPGWYVDGGAGGNFTPDGTTDTRPSHTTLSYDQPGYDVEGGGGYAWDNGFRAEGEAWRSHADIAHVKGSRTSTNGHLTNTDVFANGFYDFKTGTMFTPYLGAGVGIDFVDADHIGTLPGGGQLNGDDMEMAYQGIAGVAAQLDTNWAVTADYRYVASFDPKIHTTTGRGAYMDNSSHNVLIGLRYSFGQPAQYVAPVQTMAPARPMAQTAAKPAVAPIAQSYMVFFDFDKATLTPEAKRILASAAQDYSKGGFVKIVVTGHTDTVGSMKFNQKLSQQRAASVKAELVRLGITNASVEAVGVGKNGLLVPTADGVREAQNRRAEIVFDKQ